LGEDPGGAAGPSGEGPGHRLVPGGHRLRLGAGRFWGTQTDPNPTDRGKAGTKLHLVTDGQGAPLAVKQTGANVHDSEPALELVDSIPPIRQWRGRPRRRPVVLVGDKAYGSPEIHWQLRQRRIGSLIARQGQEDWGLGRLRWVVERTLAWLNQFRRLRLRYEKRADIHQAFLTIGCLLMCWNFVQSWLEALRNVMKN